MKISDVSAKTIEFFKKHGKRIACTAVVAGMISLPVDEAIAEEHDETVFQNPSTKQEQVVDVTNSTVMMSEDNANSHLLQQASKSDNGSQSSIGMQTTEVTISIGDKTVTFEPYIANPEVLSEQIEQIINENFSEEINEINNNQDMEFPTFIIEGPWEKTKNYRDGTGFKKANREYKREIIKVIPSSLYNFSDFDYEYKKILDFIVNDKNASKIFDIAETTVEIILVNNEEEQELDTDSYTMYIEGTEIKIVLRKTNETYSYYELTNDFIELLCSIISVVGFASGVFMIAKSYNS